MTRHHHDAGRGHPPRTPQPSLLRMSAAARVVAASALAALLWAAVWWAIS